MEKIQIENAIEFNKQHGKDVGELQARLDEIESKTQNTE
jgi:tetrahydromethanopterin S-methyltransferase subunit G